jgi:hypothetical protein
MICIPENMSKIISLVSVGSLHVMNLRLNTSVNVPGNLLLEKEALTG